MTYIVQRLDHKGNLFLYLCKNQPQAVSLAGTLSEQGGQIKVEAVSIAKQ